jgi:rhodanese-related sulfurtransferase
MTFRTGRDLVDEARARVKEISGADARELRARDPTLVFLDVREANEWNLGRVPGAKHITRGNLESRVEALLSRDQNILVYCARGNRSALAAVTLAEMGYASVASISDGWAGWLAADGEVEG